MNRKVLKIAAFLLLFLCTSLNAASVAWKGYVSDSWTEDLNWSTGMVPTTADEALLNDPNIHVKVLSGETGYCNKIRIAYYDPNVVLTVESGATLTATGPAIRIGYTTGGVGTLNIYGTLTASSAYLQMGYSNSGIGTVNQIDASATYSYVHVGHGAEESIGTYNIQGGSLQCEYLIVGRYGQGLLTIDNDASIDVGGSLTIGQLAGSVGHVQFNDGIINTAAISMPSAGDHTMEIVDGILKIADTTGDAASLVESYIGNGWITARGGRGALVVEWNGSDLTTVYSPPIDLDQAWNPSPSNGAGVNPDPTGMTLNWSPGNSTAAVNGHHVYFGDSYDDVDNATTSTSQIYRGTQNLDANSYTIPEQLTWGKTYYWRIDQFDGTNIKKGQVWKFTVNMFVLIDNFESYNSTADLKNVWKDRDDFSGTWATISLSDTTFNTGEKSMRVLTENYANELAETQIEFSTAQNWASLDVKSISIWWRGLPDNEDLGWYIKLTDSSNASATVNYSGEQGLNTQEYEPWNEWNLALTEFAGINFAAIKKFTIGFNGSYTNDNQVWIDDIRLYQTRCMGAVEGDLNDDCKIDFLDIAVISENWLESNLWP